MDWHELLKRYDFTESDVLDVRIEQGTKGISLYLDYYWQLDNSETKDIGPSQPIRVGFLQCRKCMVMNDASYVLSAVGNGQPQTVISWGDATGISRYEDFCTDLEDGEMALHFQLVGPGGDSRLAIVCRDVVVEPTIS